MIKLKIKYGNSQTDLRFPCTEKEMSAALERIHAEDVTPLELYMSEVIFPEELGYLQDRFVNLNEVNYLGKRMDSFFGDEEYQFYEAMKLEGFDTLHDLINLSFNLNRYPLIQDISDMGKIGREYLLTVKGCLPADDADDPKYADFGRKLIQSGKGVFTEHGLLFVDEDTPFVRDYDGQNYPAYVYEEMLCFLRAEYNGKTEFLYLPCEEEAIDKAFARLGAPTPDDVALSWEDIRIENEKWTERFKEIAAEEGVYELNRLAAAVNSADMDMEKPWAVGIHHQVNMRMMCCIMKSSVPLHIGRGDSMSLCYLQSISADKFFPCIRTVVSEPFRVLTPQADYMRPQYAFMICHFICDIINIDFIIRLRKQSVPAELFNARALSIVTDQLFYTVNTVCVAFYECVKKFSRRISTALFLIHFQFRIHKRFGNSGYTFADQLSLLSRCRFMINPGRQFFNTFACSHIFYQLARIRLCGIFDIAACKYDLRHSYSPRCHS